MQRIEMMPKGWKKYKLKEVAEIIGGGTPSTAVEEYWNGNIPWLTPRDLTNHSYNYIDKGERSITELGLRNSSTRLLPEGSVLMTSRAPIGYLAIAENPICTNQGFKSFITDNKKVNNQFLFYLLKNNIEYIKSLGTGTTFAEVSGSTLKKIEFEIPEDLSIQSRIASILSSLDDKIELNLQMNKTLEAISQAIFKEWFVDFRFPGFEGELVYGLPNGWKKVQLSHLAQIEIGRTPPRMENHWFSQSIEDIKWISIKDMGESGVFISKTYENLTSAAKDKFRIPEIPPNTVVLSFKLTIGRVAITTESMLSNEAIAQIRSSALATNFLYLLLKNYNFDSLGSTSSIASAINSKIIKEMEIIMPKQNIMDGFCRIIDPIFDKIRANSMEIITLSNLRDSLLPKLMTGKIKSISHGN